MNREKMMDNSPLANWLKRYNEEYAVFSSIQPEFTRSCESLSKLTGWDLRKMEENTAIHRSEA